MPFDRNELRRVMGHFATGVTIVTTHDGEGRCYGLTANAVSSVSLDPPLILVCVDKRAESHPAFALSQAFVVNILSDEQEELSRRLRAMPGAVRACLHSAPALGHGAPGPRVVSGLVEEEPSARVVSAGLHACP